MVPRGSLGFPVVFPLQAPCLPTASVKLGVSVDNSEGQQARYVLRPVLQCFPSGADGFIERMCGLR